VRSYLSGLKYHWHDLGGEAAVFENQERFDRIIKGHARVRGAASAPLLQEPLTAELFATAMETVYPAGKPRSYRDKLELAAMAMGIYAVLRPGEMVVTKEDVQRQEAMLKLRQIFIIVEGDSGATRHPRFSNRIPLTSFVGASNQVAALIVHLNCSKTDQLMVGADVTVGDPCAIGLIMDYLQGHPRRTDDAAHVFMHADQSPMTSAQLTAAIRSLLDSAGIVDHERYTGRSLRKGGTQTLFDTGATLQSIGHSGRWTNTVTPMKYYVKHSAASKIHASRRMAPDKECIGNGPRPSQVLARQAGLRQ